MGKNIKIKWHCISNGIQESPSQNVKIILKTKDSRLALELSQGWSYHSWLNQHGALFPMLLREPTATSTVLLEILLIDLIRSMDIKTLSILMDLLPCGMLSNHSMDYLNHGHS